MGIFQKLFGGDGNVPIDKGGKAALTPEQFLETKFVRDTAARYGKTAMVLNPSKSLVPIGPDESKFGGTPNLNNFDAYPCCDGCGTALNFVVQLYREDLAEHYWPGDSNLFQLFRCPNEKCPAAFSAPYHADHKMFVYYFYDGASDPNTIFMPDQPLSDNHEPPVPDCKLNIAPEPDYPHYEDFDEVITGIENTYGETYGDLFMDTYYPVQRSKSGGYPSYTQSSHEPMCACGKPKEFFFQLSSEDTEPHVTHPVPDNWSPHGIMIGDLGNIYFYVCKDCGEQSIESYWDCY